MDFCLVPVDGSLKLAILGGVGAELVLGGGVLDRDLDGDLVPLFSADLGGVMANTLATASSSLGLSPRSAAVFSSAPQTFVHRRRKSPRDSPLSLSDMNTTSSLN